MKQERGLCIRCAELCGQLSEWLVMDLQRGKDYKGYKYRNMKICN